jgi:hypothetical protein
VLTIERHGAEPHWLVGSVELEVGSTGLFHAIHRDLYFRTDQVTGFRDQVRELYRVLTGSATLEHDERQFKATITLDKGKGELSGFVREYERTQLEFVIPTDQSYVGQALAELEAVVEAFPVRTEET